MAPSSVRSVDVARDSTVHAATGSATSLADLITTVPQAWRPAVGPYLTSILRVTSKLCTVQNTLAQYDRHTAEGSFPASVMNAVRDPKVQFSKEFLQSETGKLSPASLKTVVHNARKTLLEAARAEKQHELENLQSHVKFEETAWKKILLDVAERIASTYGCKVEGSTESKTPPTWAGDVPDSVKGEAKTLWIHGSVWHYRVISIARATADRSLLERTRTLSIKKDTDVQMKDADIELSTRDVVRDEMKAQLSLLRADLVKTMNQAKKPAGKKGAKKGAKGGQNNPRVGKKKQAPKGSKKKAKK